MHNSGYYYAALPLGGCIWPAWTASRRKFLRQQFEIKGQGQKVNISLSVQAMRAYNTRTKHYTEWGWALRNNQLNG